MMWRKVDLHTHTHPDDGESDFSAEAFVQWALDGNLNVVAVTDHMVLDRVEPVIAQAHSMELTVVPGVELHTDRGHVLAVAPGPGGADSLRSLMDRLGAPARP